MITLALALSVATIQEGAATAPSPVTVADWKTREERQRQLLVVAAVEGLLLASSGQDGEASWVNGQCLSDARLDDIMDRLSREEGASPLALSIMEVSGCSR